jgi:Tol biopolymer transport system component
MGEVYRARDLNLGRDVAIKILPETFVADTERVVRFQREAQVLAALHHANIATIFGLEDSGPSKILVMELVEGEPLDARIARGPLSLDDALAVARQIGEALSAAHEKAIIHRDLKPGNVMVRPDGAVKVLDFGLAKRMDLEPAASGLSMSPTISIQATMAGTLLGTTAYMSPEQARGRAVDKRTDVWAFGCVLFEMLTARRTFAGDDVTETIAAIVKSEPDWSALTSQAPPWVETIVRGCLMKDPKQRFADIAVPLYLLTKSVPTPAVPAPASTVSAPMWRRALPVAAAIVVTAAIVTAGAWFLRPAPRPALVARFPVALSQDQSFSNTGRRVLAVSPDGANVAYVANGRLYLRSLADAEAHVIPGTETQTNGLTNPAFSPDGRQLAFFANADGVLKRISVGGGLATTVCPATNPQGIRWEEEGLVFAQEGKSILRVSPNGGAPTVLVSNNEGVLSSPQVLPDGRGVLFSTKKDLENWDQGHIVVQTTDGKQHTVMTGAADGQYLPSGHLVYARAGVLLAVPFDLDRLATSGDPVPVVEGVRRVDIGASRTRGPGFAQFAVSDAGTLVYVPGPVKPAASDGDRVLAIFDGKDGMERLPVPTSSYRAPRASPVGGMVAFESDTEPNPNIFVYNLTGAAAPQQLTFAGTNRAPVWSPDGQWIAFQSDRESDVAIFRQRADGSGAAERLTTPAPGTRHTPLAWSPDGRHILFTRDNDSNYELSILTLSDKTIAPFGDVRSRQLIDGVFSPDGRWLLYALFEQSNGRHAFVEPFPPTGAKYLVPVESAGHPMWVAQDHRLIFNTGPQDSQAVRIRTGPGVTFSRPVSFSRKGRIETSASNLRNVDVLPDGRLIGVARKDDAVLLASDSDRFMVVVNWFTELNERVPTGTRR